MVDFHRSLRPASIRGISFLTPGDDAAFGRRIVRHEFPGRDDPGHEDLGAKTRTFNIEAIVEGQGFVGKAAALEKALQSPGPATLIHPHYGEIIVVVMDATRNHSSAEVGMVRFTIQLEKYGSIQYPSAASNTAAGLLTASQGGFAAAVAEFNSFFRGGGLPDFVMQDAIARNTSFMGGLNTLLTGAGITSVIPALDVLSGGFAQSAVDFYQSLMDMVSPRKKPVIGSAPAASTATPRNFVKAMLSAADQSLVDTVPATTSNRSARAVNAQSLDFLHRLSALGAGVGSVRHISFESREEAVSIRDGFINQLSTLRDQLGATGWDQSWKAAGDLQAALNRDISERVGRLPRTLTIRPASVRSSLALANRLYGDNPASLVKQAADLSSRNAVRHPGFVPVKNLEVLIDAN